MMSHEMDDHSQPEALDPRLGDLLNRLRPTPERSEEAVERGLNRFLTELDAMPAPSTAEGRSSLWTRMQVFREEFQMFRQNRRVLLTVMAVLVIGLLFLFGGSAMTVMASDNAIPGDALYPVKTQIEQTRLNLARDAARRAELQLAYANRRLEETRELVAEGRYQNIKATTTEFEAHIESALAEVDILLAQGDANRAAELMRRISATLAQYSAVLGDLANNVPEPVRADMESSIQNARLLSGNDNFNGNFNDNLNGSLNDNVNDNLNSNSNTNDNVNDNMNDNSNTNDNVNDSLNDNSNTNDSVIDNVNDNDNANTNSSNLYLDDYNYGDDNDNDNSNDNDD
jgi:hypothetical protein